MLCVLVAVALATVASRLPRRRVWSGAGTGTSLAGITTFDASRALKATPGGEAVTLEWGAVTPPGSGAVDYYVTGEGGTPGTGCPMAATPSTLTSGTDTGVSIGADTYQVTAVWRSWTSTSEAKSVTVTSGPATHLVLATQNGTRGGRSSDHDRDGQGRRQPHRHLLHRLAQSRFEGAAAAPSGTKPSVSNETGTAVAFAKPPRSSSKKASPPSKPPTTDS